MSTTLLLERADGNLSIKTDQTKESLSVYTNGLDIALLTQNAKEGLLFFLKLSNFLRFYNYYKRYLNCVE